MFRSKGNTTEFPPPSRLILGESNGHFIEPSKQNHKSKNEFLQQKPTESGNVNPSKKLKKKPLKKYKGCTSTESETIANDIKTAKKWLKNAIKKLEKYDGKKPTIVFDALEAHFGGSTSWLTGKIIKHKLKTLLGTHKVAGYQCLKKTNKACKKGDPAMAYWCIPFTDIRLCPSFFTSRYDNLRPKILIHEWSHKYHCTGDVAYRDKNGDKYRKLNLLQQLLNADSYAQFVKDVQ